MKDIYLNSVDCGYDVICLSETWLKPGVNDCEIFCQDYQVFRKDRLGGKSGGGVLIAVHCTFPAELVNFSSDCDSEYICVRLRCGLKSFLISCCYIPPNSCVENYMKHFRLMSLAVEIMDSSSDIICVGDFNLPLTSWVPLDDSNRYLPSSSSTLMEDFFEGISDIGLHQFNNILNANNRILDLIFSNSQYISLFRTSPLVSPEDKHHPTLRVSLDICVDSVEKCRNIDRAVNLNFSSTNFALQKNFLISHHGIMMAHLIVELTISII